MPKLSSITPAVTMAALVSLLGGGFAGAVFTWFVHRPTPALVTYTTTVTTTGTDPVVKGIIPNLTLKIGDEDVPVVYTHVIDLAHVRGDYVDAADFAITFPSGMRIFGFSATPPSVVHSISCKQAPEGIICRLSPIAPDAKYRVSIAGDQRATPQIMTSSRNTDLTSLDTFVSRESRSLRTILTSKEAVYVALVSMIYFTGLAFLWKKWKRLRNRPLILVGKLVDDSGNPIAGAVVGATLEHPARQAHEYRLTTTDGQGDFIFGGLTKYNVLGTIRVEHNDYSPLTMHFDSPIILLKLGAKMRSPQSVTGQTPLAIDVPPEKE